MSESSEKAAAPDVETSLESAVEVTTEAAPKNNDRANGEPSVLHVQPAALRPSPATAVQPAAPEPQGTPGTSFGTPELAAIAGAPVTSSAPTSADAQPSVASTKLKQLCNDAVDKAAQCLQGELLLTIKDYELLEQMNRLTMAKYAEMKQTTTGTYYALQEINDKYKSLRTYLNRIDEIEAQIGQLEETVYKLDNASKKLEAKYKELDAS